MMALHDEHEVLKPAAGSTAVARTRQAAQSLHEYAATRDTSMAAIADQIATSVEAIIDAERSAGLAGERRLAHLADRIEAFLRASAH